MAKKRPPPPDEASDGNGNAPKKKKNGAQNRRPENDGRPGKGDGNGEGTPPKDYVPSEDDSPFKWHTVAQRKFFAAYVELGSVTAAIKLAGLGQYAHYNWKTQYVGYRKSWTKAKRMAAQRAEDEAMRRAVDGTVRLKFHEGQMIMVPKMDENGAFVLDDNKQRIMVPYRERQYSDQLLIAILKANDPDRYRENTKVQMEVDGNFRVAGKDIEASRNELISRMDSLIKINGKNGTNNS